MEMEMGENEEYELGTRGGGRKRVEMEWWAIGLEFRDREKE